MTTPSEEKQTPEERLRDQYGITSLVSANSPEYSGARKRENPQYGTGGCIGMGSSHDGIEAIFEDGSELQVGFETLGIGLGSEGSDRIEYMINYTRDWPSKEVYAHVREGIDDRGEEGEKNVPLRAISCSPDGQPLSELAEKMTKVYHFIDRARSAGLEQYFPCIALASIGMHIVSRLHGVQVQINGK